VFEKIFSIIREEGYSDGGVVVQVVILEQHNWPLENCLLVFFCLKLAANCVCSVKPFLIFYRYITFS